ncbi:MgtC/SapB family protein [Bacillus sp. JJ722]|uniref:MgtC/SapB family protein n=1 Tax=Bacillus sp. JJ722 TaxID=3122973 RepID=UPI002FFFE4ED
MDIFTSIIDFHTRLDIFLKLGITAILGLIIGIEREMRRKPVGLKTSLVISIVSCLLTIVSIKSAYLFPSSDHVNITMDPLRLAAQIISGIGFLGAGVILRKENDSISGLTTAAMIWGAAGLGIAVGAGFYIEAIAGVFLIIISVEIIPLIMSVIGPKQLRQKEVLLQLSVFDKQEIGHIIHQIQKEGISIKNIRIKDMETAHFIQLKTTIHYQRRTVDVYTAVSNIEGIQTVEIESL